MLYIWSVYVRVSHWLLVAAFAVAWQTGGSLWQADTHAMAGYAAGMLMLGRIVWGTVARGYCSFSRFPFRPRAGLRYLVALLGGHARRFIGHNPAGSLAIYGMLGLGLLTVATGLLVFNDGYLPGGLPDFSGPHHALAWSWLALVMLHVLGVAVESVAHHENLVASMITGCKPRHVRHRYDRYTRLLWRCYARTRVRARRLWYGC